MTNDAPFGYLMVHFVEDPDGYAEKIYLSLSRGEDPTSWSRLHGGEPILASGQGTTGLRDPHLVRSPAGDRFYLVATDLRVFGGDDAGWPVWSRHGSRSIMVWETADLVTWSPGRLVEVAPENAGMAWAPESVYDDERGEYIVFWSSHLFEDDSHSGPTYSRILAATTRDFASFSPAQVYLDTGSTTIDTTMIRHGGKVFRFHKDNESGGRQLYADVVSSLFADDAIILQERIGAEYGDVEGPLVFKDNYAERWFLFVDHYGDGGVGYRPFVSTDLEAGNWAPFDGTFELPVDTKHGVVLPLRGGEWERLAAAGTVAGTEIPAAAGVDVSAHIESDDLPVVRVAIGEPTGSRVSPDLWGLFLEDINFALDGGLNADLVRNGDFEATPADRSDWHALTGWTVGGDVQVRSATPLSAANATYARLTARDGESSLVNAGYGEQGMAVQAGRYRLRLAARAIEGSELTARVRPKTAEGEPAPAVQVAVPPGQDWTWIETDLDVRRAGWAVLELTLVAGSVDVDLIELRPIDPEAGTPRLFRPDLLDALRALRPTFLRFPGGCVAHGVGLDNVYHWKTTIGPREQRRPMPNCWGYHQSMAIGYHEYFLLCEELGATPMPIVAAGVCCQNAPGGPAPIPLVRMPQYVQDVLDLIEYANGDSGTRWGAVRAANGHPEPFNLRYLGLGNEDMINDAFAERFELLHSAVRKAHPEVTPIGTVGPGPSGSDFDAGWKLARELDVPIVDEHMYSSPRWFLQNRDRYDNYDRSGPAVYLGEWAARSSTIRSAVAEAAFMIGLERNSDIVPLASYAPLLSRVGDTQWTPDLIYFTDDEVRLSASYHIHRMLSDNRGDHVLAVEVSGASQVEQPEPSLKTLRLRCPGATTHFGDIRIGGRLHPDVTCGPEQTIELAGEDQAIECSLTATRVGGSRGFEVEFGDPGTSTAHGSRVGGWRNDYLGLFGSDDGITHDIGDQQQFGGVLDGEHHRWRLRLDGARIRVWLNDALVHDVVDDLTPTPTILAGATLAGNARHITVANPGDADREVRCALDGVTGTVSTTVTMLAGRDPEAGRPFESAPVSPEQFTVEGEAGFTITLPAWSVMTARTAPQNSPARPPNAGGVAHDRTTTPESPTHPGNRDRVGDDRSDRPARP